MFSIIGSLNIISYFGEAGEYTFEICQHLNWRFEFDCMLKFSVTWTVSLNTFFEAIGLLWLKLKILLR